MSITITIPTPLRPFVNNQDEIKMELESASVEKLLKSLTSTNQNLEKHLFNSDGSLRNFVNVYVNEEDIRYLQGSATNVKSGDIVSIVPSIAGG